MEMNVSIELPDGTVASWTLSYEEAEHADATLAEIVKVIGEPDSMT